MVNLTNSFGLEVSESAEVGSDTAPGLPYGTAPTGVPKPVVSLETAINYMRSYGGTINDLNNYADWTTTTNSPISYFIPQLAPGTPMSDLTWSADRAFFTQMSATKISQAVRAFELWDDLMAYDMDRISGFDNQGLPANPGVAGMIQFFYHSGTDGTNAPFGYLSGAQTGNATTGFHNTFAAASVEFQLSDDRSDADSDIGLGQLGFEFYLHEIGHALGLWHPGPYNGSAAANQVYMYQDNVQFTVMSYNRPSQTTSLADFGNLAVWGNLSASTPMVYDIAAIQTIYGADPNTHTGNDAYGVGAVISGKTASQALPYALQANRGGVFSIYDAGGIDLLNGEIYTDDQTIDLTPGSYSSMGRDGGLTGDDLTFNVGIAFNTVIENARGGSGNDRLVGNDADNTLDGNNGNDTLIGGLGSNRLLGGNGNDTFILGDGADTVIDIGGFDIVAFTHASTINFEAGNAAGDPSNDLWNETFIERFDGSPGDDAIILTIAGGGQHEIHGGDGRDILGGNADIDLLDGGAGNDFLYARDADDRLYGWEGNDELNGDSGNDYFVGGTGNDALNGGSGNNDTADFSDHYGGYSDGWTIDLIAQTAVTLLVSTLPNAFFLKETDTLNSIEKAIGSGGSDTFLASVNCTVNGGPDGIDSLYLAQADILAVSLFPFLAVDTVDLEAGTSARQIDAFSNIGIVNFTNIGIIHTANGSDSVTGSARNDTVFGDEGNDSIGGAAGNDVINGGAGADTLDGGTDLDVGDTLSYAGSAAGVSINIATNTAQGGDAQGDIISNFENITGSSFGDQLVGNTGKNILSGGAGNDLFVGGLGADTMIGGADLDVVDYTSFAIGVSVNLTAGTGPGGDVISEIENITGSAFGDVLNGDNGANTMRGGAGNDFMVAGNGADLLIGGADNDEVSYETATTGVLINLITGTGANGGVLQQIENIRGSAFGDVLQGDNGSNTIRGLAGNDYIIAGNGADLIIGGADNDTVSYETATSGIFANLTTGIGANGGVLQEIENLTGSAFGDVLIGSALGNTLKGGAGNDYIVGNAGSDALFGGADNDIFRFETTTFGNDVITDFQDNADKLSFASAIATTFSQFTILNNTTNNVTVQVAGQSIVVQGVANITLNAGDFLFV